MLHATRSLIFIIRASLVPSQGTVKICQVRIILPILVEKAGSAVLIDAAGIHAFLSKNRKIGQTIDVLIDEVDEEGAIGRSKADAPEIDGMVYLNDETDLVPGEIVQAVVEHADEHDLWGRLVR